MATMVGIVCDSFLLIQVGHVGFVVALYIGAITLCLPDLWLVKILCITAVVTRRLFNGCLLDLVSQRTYTNHRSVDPVFLFPLVLSLAVIPSPSVVRVTTHNIYNSLRDVAHVRILVGEVR